MSIFRTNSIYHPDLVMVMKINKIIKGKMCLIVQKVNIDPACGDSICKLLYFFIFYRLCERIKYCNFKINNNLNNQV